MENQDKTFFKYEGDNWFKRNRDSLKTSQDLPLYFIEQYNLKPKNVLEVGASNGYRLAEIHKKFKSNVFALEPSSEAIEEGKKKWPFINFQKATAATMVYNRNSFDLVIVHSVFHWIDRNTLLNSIAKIDDILCWGGHFIVGDFQLPFPLKRRYSHIRSKKVFTYKVDYKKIFLATGFYKEVATISQNHDRKLLTAETTIDNFFSVSLLKKEELYIEQ